MKAGWQKKKLNEVCELVNGRAYSKPELLSKGKYRVLRVGNFFTNDHWYYSDLELDEKKYCDTGDLLYAWSASFGPRIWSGEKVIFHYHIWKVLPDYALIDKKFLFLWFLWDTEQIKEDQGAGTTMIHVSKGSMDGRDILLPPLPDQQRIVGILDEAFDGIATAKANAEQCLQNARALFESHLQSVFTQCGEGWMEKPLSALCDIKHGFAFDGAEFSSDVPDGKPIVITPGNFTEDGKLLFNEKNTKRFSGKPPTAFRFDIGDLVVVMTDLSSKMKILGKPAFVETDDVLHNQRIGRVVFFDDSVEKRFVYYFMMSESFLKHIKMTATGTMVKHTAPSRILSNVISFPVERKEQIQLAAKLDTLRAETQRLASLYQRKLAALDELKKSLLHQAFSGML